MEKAITNWETQKAFSLIYKGEKIDVRLVRHQGRSAAEWFFQINTANQKNLLLSKREFRNKILWIGGGISHEEAQEMGPAIETQLGHPVPLPESINPFEYKGDIGIPIHRFLLGNIPTEQAKNPYSGDVWYKVYLPLTTIVVVYAANFDNTGFSWILDSPSNLAHKHVKMITDLLDLYEKTKQDNH